MTDFEKVLINRDGMTEEEAKNELINAKKDIYDLLEDAKNGNYIGYTDIEDYLCYEYGLEMDYFFDIIF